MKGAFCLTYWFYPTSANNGTNYYQFNKFGNIENFPGYSNGDTYWLNYEELYNDVFNNNLYSSAIYANVVAGESDASYPYNTGKINIPNIIDPNISSAIPPSNVHDAIAYFNLKKLPGHKIIQAQGPHGKYVIPGVKYDSNSNFTLFDYFSNQNRGDIQIEHAYYAYEFFAYLNKTDASVPIKQEKCYLGKYISIDNEKQLFNGNIHAEIQVNSLHSCLRDKYITSSNPFKTKNFNHTWFQTYNSIIHGAKGVWYYELNEMWEDDEEACYILGYCSDGKERFHSDHFPRNYKSYLKHLANELAYLKSKGILTANENNIIFSRATTLNNPIADPLGIVPACSTYLPKTLNNINARDFFDVNNEMRNDPDLDVSNAAYPQPQNGTYQNYHSIDNDEFYGICYSIRTNGTEVYMILSNPNPVSMNVPLDFSNVDNPLIKSATEIEVLFETGPGTSDPLAYVESATYKTTRNSVDWKNGIVKTSYLLPYANKKCTLAFGPLDIHVLRFNRPHFDNQWENIWTNGGQNFIGGWNMRSFDKYYPGDFDGDGSEELLCVQHYDYPNKYAGLTKYGKNNNHDDWNWMWTNGGNNKIGDWVITPSDKILVGNFEGTGQDEVMIIQSKDASAKASIYKFINNIWTCVWTNSGNGTIGGWNIRSADKYIIGHFNNTTRRDELLAIQGFDYTNNWAILQSFSSPNWSYLFSNGGNGYIGNWLIKVNDSYLAGDFNGNKKSELIINNTSSSLKMYAFNGSWSNPWTDNGTSGIAAYRSDLLVADINGDGTDDIFGNSHTGWLTTFYYSNNNANFNWWWSSNSDYYLDDLYIPDVGYTTKYIPIKVKNQSSANILAIREYSNTNHLASMYAYTPNSNNYLGSIVSYEKKKYCIYVPMKSQVTATTCFNETTYDTKLAIYTETGTTSIASNDDDPSCATCTCSPKIRASKIIKELEQGYYYIEVSGYSNSYGNYRLDVNMENIYTIPFTVYRNTIEKQNNWDVQGGDGRDMAYKFYLPSDISITSSLCNTFTNYDTKLEIFKADKTTTNYYNDDNGCGLKSVLNNKNLTAGYYYMVVDGYNGLTGNFKLNVTSINASTKSTCDQSTEQNKKLSESESFLENVNIYPNPTKGIFTIEFTDKENIPIRAEIFNSSGILVRSLDTLQSKNEFDISSLSKGIYFIKIFVEDKMEVFKLIYE